MLSYHFLVNIQLLFLRKRLLLDAQTPIFSMLLSNCLIQASKICLIRTSPTKLPTKSLIIAWLYREQMNKQTPTISSPKRPRTVLRSQRSVHFAPGDLLVWRGAPSPRWGVQISGMQPGSVSTHLVLWQRLLL